MIVNFDNKKSSNWLSLNGRTKILDFANAILADGQVVS